MEEMGFMLMKFQKFMFWLSQSPHAFLKKKTKKKPSANEKEFDPKSKF